MFIRSMPGKDVDHNRPPSRWSWSRECMHTTLLPVTEAWRKIVQGHDMIKEIKELISIVILARSAHERGPRAEMQKHTKQ